MPLGCPPPAPVADDPPLVDELPDDLLEEERVPVGTREHRLPGLVGQLLDGEEHLDECGRVVVRQGLEEDRAEVAFASAPSGAALREIGPRRAHEEQRACHPVRELLEQVEKRVVRPMDVLDHDDRRLIRRQPGEECPPRLVGLQSHLARRQRR